MGDTAERETRIENEYVVATFTNRGARLKSWRFKKHRDSAGEPFELVVDDASPGHYAAVFAPRRRCSGNYER